MKPIIRLTPCILCCIFLFSGCHKEVYDPEALERDYFIQNIPEGFDWSTISSVQLEVIPYDQYEGQYPYTIEVFDKNPLLDETAALYTIGWCTGDKPLRKSITLPTAQSLVYVRQTTPGGRRTIKETEIIDGRVSCHFAPEVTPVVKSASLPTRSEEDIPDKAPDNCIEIDINKEPVRLEKGKKYILRKDYTGQILFPDQGHCDLYVKATWVNTKEEWTPVIVQNNSNVYILPEGKIVAKNGKCKFQFSNDATLGINHNAQLGEEGKNNVILQFGTKGYLVNEGKLYCDQITAESPDLKIVNKGQFYANLLKSGSNYTFDNECYVYIKTVEMPQGSELEIEDKCSFVADEMTMKGSSIELEEKAFLKVGHLHTVYSKEENKISGPDGKEFALVRIERLTCEWNNEPTVVFKDKVYVGCTNYPSNQDLFKIKIYEDIKSGATVKIPSNECSEGNNYVPETPQQPEFPRWEVVYNKPHTFASEDNFPSPGDYDLNDLVVSLDSIAHYYIRQPKDDDDDKVIGSIKFYLTLRAVGATRQLGAAIQLDELDEDKIKSVRYSKTLPLDNFQINSNGVEKGQEHAVIPLFDNAHKALGIDNTSTIVNTISNTPKWITDAAPCSFEVTVEFTSPVEGDDVKLDELNYFVIVGSRREGRTEIHLPDKDHTDLSSTPGEEQLVDKKFMWTIGIPTLFRYPHEWENIKNVYPDFEAWVHSGGEKPTNWYDSPKEELLYKKR